MSIPSEQCPPSGKDDGDDDSAGDDPTVSDRDVCQASDEPQNNDSSSDGKAAAADAPPQAAELEAGGDTSSQDGAAHVLSGLPNQLMDKQIKDSLNLVDITFGCKVCGMKAKSLPELVAHMKNGQCTTKRRPRGRPRKTEQANSEQGQTPTPAKKMLPQEPSERVTRVKSGAIKRKSVADLFIKQEPDSSGDEDYAPEFKRKKRVISHTVQEIYDSEDSGDASQSVANERFMSGTQALAACKDAKLSGPEIRIPIGSFKEGESKIIALKTANGGNMEEIAGSILHIQEVDKKPVVQVLDGEGGEEANTTIYLRTVGSRTEEDGQNEEMHANEGDAITETVHIVELDAQNMEAIQQGQMGLNDELNVTTEGNMINPDVNPLDQVKNVEVRNIKLEEESEWSEGATVENGGLAVLPPIRRRYTKLPSTAEFPSDIGDKPESSGMSGAKCRKCVQRWFQTREELDIHYGLHMTGKAVGYQCDVCSYTTSNWGRMMYHLVKHPEYSERLRGTHMMRNIYGSFPCPVCGKIFELKSNLSAHHNKMHVHESKVCPHCEKLFNDMDEKKFERHMDKCRGEEMSCDFCPYTTAVRSNLKVHMKVHSGEGFDCKVCGKMFPTKQRWEVHQQKHASDRPRYPCEICARDFCSRDAVKKHVERIHSEKSVLYKCSICSYTTKQETDFKKHLKSVHEKKFQCPVEGCDFGTNKMDQLTMHNEYHDPERIFKCTYANCYHAFSTQKNLAGHMQGVHKIGCKHQCPICLKYFKKKTVLLRHLVSHTTERPYSCHECGLTFTCHSTYYRHRAKTGHDARREGVASVPQNITIQYVDHPQEFTVPLPQPLPPPPPPRPPQPTQIFATNNGIVDFEGMAVEAQKVLRQELAEGSGTSSQAMLTDGGDEDEDDGQTEHVTITMDAAQYAQYQQQQQQHQPRSLLKDSNVTYYVYDSEEADGSSSKQLLVMENTMETGEKQTLEAIPLDEAGHLNQEMEDYNTQFINLDLPSGSAFVKVDESGGLTVVNNLGHELETQEVTADPEAHNPDPHLAEFDGAKYIMQQEVEAGTSLKLDENEDGVSEEVIYQEIEMKDMDEHTAVVSGQDDAATAVTQCQYIIYKGEEEGTVVEGESAAAYSMLELQGGNADEPATVTL